MGMSGTRMAWASVLRCQKKDLLPQRATGIEESPGLPAIGSPYDCVKLCLLFFQPSLRVMVGHGRMQVQGFYTDILPQELGCIFSPSGSLRNRKLSELEGTLGINSHNFLMLQMEKPRPGLENHSPSLKQQVQIARAGPSVPGRHHTSILPENSLSMVPTLPVGIGGEPLEGNLRAQEER